MPIRSHYEILGVARSATAAQIQAAFRRLAMEWHPDRNRRPDATARFREINEAYQCLRNPAMRRAYDELLQRAEADEQRSNTWQDVPHGRPDPWAEFNAQFVLRPEFLVSIFSRLDDWLRRAFARQADPSR